MSINLLTTYKRQMEQGFVHDSFTANKASSKWSWDGSETIKVKTMITIAPTESWPAGPRSGWARYGTPTDVEDVVQAMKLRHHMKWTRTIDNSDNVQSAMMYNAGAYIKQQQAEQDIPAQDKWALREWARHSGSVKTASAALSKSNIIEHLLDLEADLDEAGVPQENRYVYMKYGYRKFVRMAAEWVGADTITRDMILKGYEGNIGSLMICFVPSSYMPENVEMLATYKESVIAPVVWKKIRVNPDADGIDGALLEYHSLGDAFVIGAKNAGVITLLKNGASAQAATPTKTDSSGTTTLTSSGNTIYYTLDGTDPRYSETAIQTSSGGTLTTPSSGTTLRAIARKEAAGSEKYTSAELKVTY